MDAQDRVTLLVVECSATPSSSQRVIWELATRLPRPRYDVHVWLSGSSAFDPLARALDEGVAPVWRMPDLDQGWNLRGVAELWLRLRRMRPAILHLHEGASSLARLKRLMAGVAGTTALVVSENGGVPLRAAHANAPRDRLLDRAAAITVPCVAIADQLVRDRGADRSRVRVVREGLDPPNEAEERQSACLWRQRVAAGPASPLWVCAARLEPHKGQNVFLDALAELKRRGQRYSAVLAGEGSARSDLERRVSELGIGDAVRFVGNVDDLGSLLRAANAVVVPSQWDALPHILFEAMARQRVVVASAVGGIPEVIENQRSGVLVPAGDALALASALERIQRWPDAASRMGAEAARRVLDEYTWERAIEAYESVYDETLGFASFLPDGAMAGR